MLLICFCQVPNFAIVHLASRVPPVDFIYQGVSFSSRSLLLPSRLSPYTSPFLFRSPPAQMDMPGQQGGYTGFNALVTFSHHLEFTLRAVRFSCNDKLVWKASTTSLPFKGLLNTPTNPQKLSLSFDQHRLEFFQAQSDPRLRRQTQQFKTLLNQCMGGLSDIADFCNGSRVASKVETLSSQWLRVWKDCAGKGGASKCAKVSDEDGMMACGRVSLRISLPFSFFHPHSLSFLPPQVPLGPLLRCWYVLPTLRFQRVAADEG